jgi:sugar lactone lactonase YvrE
MSSPFELVLDAKATLGEGAIWHARRQLLYWVDILEGQLHVYNPANRLDRAVDLGQYVGTVVPRTQGGLMLALHHGLAALDLDTSQLNILHDPERHVPGNRFNDGKCDPAGRFWAGTMSTDGEAGQGSLYVLDRDHSLRRALAGVSTSNGLAWSLDGRVMYYIDTPTRIVAAFDFDVGSGSIANRREAIVIPPEHGYPDGMTIDAEGMLWIAHWGGSRVTRWDPAASRLLQTLPLPVTLVTSCAFGGPSLDELYVTSARTGLDAEALAAQPTAGGLFRARPGVAGTTAFEFAG